MNINFGLFPPIHEAPKSPEGKRLKGPEKSAAKKRMITARAKLALQAWIAENGMRPTQIAAE